jgi:Fe-S cluster assembly protein SufD
MNGVAPDKIREIIGRLPTTRDEDWKYTDLGRVREISERWLDAGAAAPDGTLDREIDAIASAIDATWFIVRNGELLPPPEAQGLDWERLDEVPLGDNALAELNAALVRDGLRITVSGDVEKPLGLLVIDGAETAAMSHSYVEIAVAESASCQVVEFHASTGEADQYHNAHLSLSLGAGASLRHVRIQNRSLSHVQTGRTVVKLGSDTRFSSAGFDLGGGLVRNDLAVDIASPGAEAAFDGLYLAGDGQHIDNHTRVDHRVGPATSRQEYRGILNGKCRCVWNGKAIVHEGADGTDADQANHNLLLSEKAEIDAKPELEIYTDDVKCSHGTTVGQLDETALFYLRTRGLDKRLATQVLTHAFAAGLVSRVPVDAARETVSALMEKRLGELIKADEDFTV